MLRKKKSGGSAIKNHLNVIRPTFFIGNLTRLLFFVSDIFVRMAEHFICLAKKSVKIRVSPEIPDVSLRENPESRATRGFSPDFVSQTKNLSYPKKIS